ncbi:hypothetical protein BDV96DRAFT_639840 [Lophiotrema nucula]|uniref:Nephrocystin 3-like N-terminal domain-containing protein n=1 Tax=Lophiotrema nucula TaxID=690887 RepID=A0A6A5ZSA7_9PLEO|nr:hypothetical protein BDV96DRAFT_639840 [Lophiotrema nucula]
MAVDPLSVAASIAGLLGLTIQVVEIGAKFTSKKARRYDFIFELNSLADVLKLLKASLDSETATTEFNKLSVFIQNSTHCEIKLKAVLEKLQKTVRRINKFERAWDTVLWPLTEKEHREAIEDIQRFAQIFHFALNIEGRSLLARTTAEARSALQEQAQRLEETKKFCESIPGLGTKIDSSLDEVTKISVAVQELAAHAVQVESIARQVTGLEAAVAEKFACQDEKDDEELQRRILRWLSPLSFEAKHRQLSNHHQSGTGAWFIQDPIYMNWKQCSGDRNLWCSGIPGAGKTFIANVVINELRDSEHNVSRAPLIFIYADYKDHSRLTFLDLLSCVSRQLASQDSLAMKVATLRFKEALAESTPEDVPPMTSAQHQELLSECSLQTPQIRICIDAVDELPGIDEEGGSDVRLEFLHALSNLNNTSIFCTSRPHIDATLYFDHFSSSTIEATESDLRIFLEARISTSRRLSNFCERDRRLGDDIVQTITSKASGMFLLARLQLEQIMTTITVRQVRNTLKGLSRKLYDVYDRTLERINDQSEVEAALGMRTLQWIACLQRPLTVSEFVQAFSVEAGDCAIDESNLIDISIILEACAGLVHLQPASAELARRNGPFSTDEDTLHFVHYTFQSFLLETRADVISSSHCDIANTCLTYLCFDTFKRGTVGSSQTVISTQSVLNRNPFQAYAAPFWPVHANLVEGGVDNKLVTMLVHSRYTGLTRAWLQIAMREVLGKPYPNIPPGFAAAAVSMHGASSILKLLLEQCNLAVNCRFLNSGTPFTIALQYGHSDCIDLIFSAGFGGNSVQNRSWTGMAYEECRKTSSMEVFYRLLTHNPSVRLYDHTGYLEGPRDDRNLNVSITSAPEMSDPLLFRAIHDSDDKLVEKLLSMGWDPSLTFTDFESTRQKSAIWVPGLAYENSWVMRTIVWKNVLLEAIKLDQLECFLLLTKAGSKLDISHPGLENPLTLAIALEREFMVAELLDAGALVNAAGGQTVKPLQQAIASRNIQLVLQLLELGAQVDDTVQRDLPNLFSDAVCEHDEDVLLHLLAFYLDCNSTAENRTLTLTNAIRNGKHEVSDRVIATLFKDWKDIWYLGAEQLLDAIIAVVPRPATNRVAALCLECIAPTFHHLDKAISFGNVELVSLLLEANLDLRSAPTGLMAPLMLAIKRKNAKIVELLLLKDAIIDSPLARFAIEWHLFCTGTKTSSLADECTAVLNMLFGSRSEEPPERTPLFPIPWLTMGRVLQLWRLGGEPVSLVLVESFNRGVRPIDMVPAEVGNMWQPSFNVGDPWYMEHYRLLSLVLEDADFKVENAIAQLQDAAANPESHLYAPAPPSQVEIKELEVWLGRGRP